MRIQAFFMTLLMTVIVSLTYAETETVVLQQGLDEYTGCTDQELRDPETNYGRGPSREVLVISEW